MPLSFGLGAFHLGAKQMSIIIGTIAGTAFYLAIVSEPTMQGLAATVVLSIFAACFGTWLAWR
jgi:uncharacterized membrane protein YeaQ/YmgE (transglycosylase-associated protein family)